MGSTIGKFLNGTLRYLNTALVILAFVTFYLSFRGFSFGAETFFQTAQALLFAGAAAVYMYAGWRLVLGILPELRSAASKAMGVGLALVFSASLIFLSSMPNVIGLAGEDAFELHFERSVGHLEQSVTDHLALAIEIDALVTELENEASRYRTAAGDERQNGSYTGAPGPGAVERAQDGVALQLEIFAKSTAADVDAFRAAAERSRLELDLLRSIIDEPIPLTDRLERFSAGYDQVRLTLSDMNPSGVASGLVRVLDRLPQEIDSRAVFSRNPDLARRQRAAIERLRADLDRTTSALGAAAADLRSDADLQIPQLAKISPMSAVTTYWRDFTHYFVGGFALDLAPLMFILFLMIAMEGKTRREMEEERFLELRVSDLVRASVANEAVKKSAKDEETQRRLIGKVLGKSDEERLSDAQKKAKNQDDD